MPKKKEMKISILRSGTVFLIGAGPGDPGLITVKGLDKIRTADVIIYDYLAGKNLIQEARPDAGTHIRGEDGQEPYPGTT